MSTPPSTERVLSLPCFEGLRLFRDYQSKYPELQVVELLSLIDSVEADAHSLDMEAAVYLSSFVDTDCSLDGHFFYQACIKGVLLKHQPIWAKLMRQGRARFVKRLNPNDQDVFAAAGLMIDPPPLHVIKWWDVVSGYTRLISDSEKMEQGRTAEILTLENERKRLKEIGIQLEPKWPGFDDNCAGYDVLSYDLGPTGVTNRLIEVKSTTLSPMRFILTRHEWNKAEQADKSYIFQIWDMSKTPPILHSRTVSEVAQHIPSDSGKGTWKSVEIPIQYH